MEIGLLFIGLPRILFWLLFQLRFDRELKKLILTHPTYQEFMDGARETSVVSSRENQEFIAILKDPSPES
ncbi:MAG: hypothetical protein ABGW77_02795 [Campylobacterales bacterium]